MQAGCPLIEAPPLETFDNAPAELGLPGDVQRGNAAIAVALCRAFEAHAAQPPSTPLLRAPFPAAARAAAAAAAAELAAGRLPTAYRAGLVGASFPGRAQQVSVPVSGLPGAPAGPATDGVAASPEAVAAAAAGPVTDSTAAGHTASAGPVTFFLDGAHTPESMAACARWFAAASGAAAGRDGGGGVDRVLLFNCMVTREPAALLPPLLSTAGAAAPLQHLSLIHI